MYPNGPQGPGMPVGPMQPDLSQFVHHDVWWTGPAHLLPLLLFAILVGVIVWGVLRLTAQHTAALAGVGAPVGPPPALPPRDHARDELRVRYARGDIDRTEYLERATDLGIVDANASDEPEPRPGSLPDQQE
jgi:putative membrane protein